ncbi:hypothetical protein F4810DRAFT_573154 [Camillea tinctor]|nr:hypothetical protein F4810DRAFT_573154 [Camillea tinctor]
MMDEQHKETHNRSHNSPCLHAESQSTQQHLAAQMTLGTPSEDPGCLGPERLSNPAGGEGSLQATQSRRFTFVIQDPVTGTTVKDKPSPVSLSKKFLDNIPKTRENWDEQREILGITSEHGILKIFDYLDKWSMMIYPERAVRPNYESLSDELEFMASGPVAERGIDLRKVEKLRSFFSLVFIAGLHVAACMDESIDFGKHFNQHFSLLNGRSCTTPASQIQRYRKAIKWIIKIVEDKWMQGAKSLAPEWIIHARAPLSMYDSWMRNKSIFDPFQITDLPEEGINAYLPLHIPICVMFAFRDRFTFTNVCAALDSKLFNEQDWQSFKLNYLERSFERLPSPGRSPPKQPHGSSEDKGPKFTPAKGRLLQAIHKASRQGNWDTSYENGRYWERSYTRDDQEILEIMHDEWGHVVLSGQFRHLGLGIGPMCECRPIRLRHGMVWFVEDSITLLVTLVSEKQPSTSVRILCKDSNENTTRVLQNLKWEAGMFIFPRNHALQVMEQELTFLLYNLETASQARIV